MRLADVPLDLIEAAWRRGSITDAEMERHRQVVAMQARLRDIERRARDARLPDL